MCAWDRGVYRCCRTDEHGGLQHPKAVQFCVRLMAGRCSHCQCASRRSSFRFRCCQSVRLRPAPSTRACLVPPSSPPVAHVFTARWPWREDIWVHFKVAIHFKVALKLAEERSIVIDGPTLSIYTLMVHLLAAPRPDCTGRGLTE
jgi:hypothetical protein